MAEEALVAENVTTVFDAVDKIPVAGLVKDEIIDKDVSEVVGKTKQVKVNKNTEEVQYTDGNHNLVLKIDERSVKFLAKSAFVLSSASIGSTLVSPIFTGLGFALGGPAFGATCFVIGKAAGCGIGLVTGKGIADKFLPLEPQSDNNSDRGLRINTNIRSQKIKKRS